MTTQAAQRPGEQNRCRAEERDGKISADAEIASRREKHPPEEFRERVAVLVVQTEEPLPWDAVAAEHLFDQVPFVAVRAVRGEAQNEANRRDEQRREAERNTERGECIGSPAKRAANRSQFHSDHGVLCAGEGMSHVAVRSRSTSEVAASL